MKRENNPTGPHAMEAMLNFKAEFQGKEARPASNNYRADIGKTMLSRDASIKGKVTGVSSRYCAACSRNHPCYLVTWEDGRETKPCAKGVKNLLDGSLQIC